MKFFYNDIEEVKHLLNEKLMKLYQTERTLIFLNTQSIVIIVNRRDSDDSVAELKRNNELLHHFMNEIDILYGNI